MHGDRMNIESKIIYYQQRHRLTIQQIAELREFSGMTIPRTSNRFRQFETMTKMTELIRLSRLFHLENLDFIPLKGPMLSWRLHRDFTIRYSHDLDILVQLENLGNAIKLLKADGYQVLYPDLPVTRNKKRLFLKIQHHIGMIHPQKKTHLEVHWRLMRFEVVTNASLDQLVKQNTETANFRNEIFKLLNKEFEFVYLILHGALHQWFRLKWLHDVVAFSKDETLDWDKVFDISKNFNAEHLVYQSIQLANRYWALPQHIVQMCDDKGKNLNSFLIKHPINAISSLEIDRVPGFVNWIKYYFHLLKYELLISTSAGYKYSYIKRMFFLEIDLNIVNLPDSLAFMYFPLRPFLFVYAKLFPLNIRKGDKNE